MSNAWTTKWMEVDEAAAQVLADKAEYIARGCYQAALIQGQQAWSGSDLAGKAGQFRSRYKASRQSVLARMRGQGLAISWERRGRRVVCVVTLSQYVAPSVALERLRA